MTDKEVVTPVPAATILMLRDGQQGLEVFMVVRHHQIDFASGALVFPGGKVDEGDTNVRDYCTGVDDLDDVALSLQVAAIREAFEECGILLARQVDGDHLISGEKLQSLHPYRERLNKGELSIREFLSSEGLLLACDQLNHFAHWITPSSEPRRFDTWFLAAPLPEGGSQRQLGNPIHLSETPARYVHASHVAGQDSDAVLKEAGFDDDEIASLRRDHAVA